MSYQLRNQLNVWWQSVSSEETLNIYQQTIQVTWRILQETARLLWLFLCLGLVLFTWLGETIQQSGRQLKTWVNSIPEPKAEYIWAETGERLASFSRSSATLLVGQARKQLGISTSPSAQVAAPPDVAAAPSPKTFAEPAPLETTAEGQTVEASPN